MSHLSHIFHHFAATHPRLDLSSFESRRDLSYDATPSPKVDLRETTNAYFFEAELPGISGPSDIKMHWLDGSTLQIQVTIEKTDLEAEWGDDIADSKPQEIMCDERNGSGENDPGQEQKPHVIRVWLNERRAGFYIRNFYFAVAVDTNGVQARLNQGLLKVLVPKTDTSVLKTKEISIKTT